MTDAAMLTATELLDLYRTRRLSPVEATRAALDRIARDNPAVNAFSLVDEEGALASARGSERRWQAGRPAGRLDGIPVSIKDLLLARGWPTRRGSLTVDPDQPWEHDSPSVARLRGHGAVLLGMTTTPERGWKGVTDSPLTGVTRNPWNTGTTPGGSSGGAAVAAALGMGALHIGTDGGGSIRIPAAFTGVFGLKPTYGRVPAWPLSPFGDVSHVGPITRSVADAALMLTVLAEPDARDWQALPWDRRDWRAGLEDGVRGLRVAWSPALGGAAVDPEVAEITAAAAAVFEELGAEVVREDPDIEPPHEIFRRIWYSGAVGALAGIPEARWADIDPGLAEIAREGAAIAHADHLEAGLARGRLGLALSLFLDRYDLLLTPALPIPAFAAGREVPEGGGMVRWTEWTPFTYPFNLTQQPAASVPCGLTQAGLPVGLQIVGPRHGEAAVLRAARAFEAARPFPFPGEPRPPMHRTE